jgi:acyl-CoA synthetase (AMP-forming)/AMP-acid ligase II
MPLFHSNAIATSSGGHYAGQTTVIMERFDPEEALRLMDRHKTTYSSMVPTMFNRIMNLPMEVFVKYDVSSMKCFIQSSAPIPFPTKQWVMDHPLGKESASVVEDDRWPEIPEPALHPRQRERPDAFFASRRQPRRSVPEGL